MVDGDLNGPGNSRSQFDYVLAVTKEKFSTDIGQSLEEKKKKAKEEEMVLSESVFWELVIKCVG